MIENRLNLKPVYSSVIYKITIKDMTFKLLIRHNPNKHKYNRFAFKLFSDARKPILRKSGLGSERSCIKFVQDLLVPKKEILYTKEKDINRTLYVQVYKLVMRRLRGNTHHAKIEQKKLLELCAKYNKKYIEVFNQYKRRAESTAREILNS